MHEQFPQHERRTQERSASAEHPEAERAPTPDERAEELLQQRAAEFSVDEGKALERTRRRGSPVGRAITGLLMMGTALGCSGVALAGVAEREKQSAQLKRNDAKKEAQLATPQQVENVPEEATGAQEDTLTPGMRAQLEVFKREEEKLLRLGFLARPDGRSGDTVHGSERRDSQTGKTIHTEIRRHYDGNGHKLDIISEYTVDEDGNELERTMHRSGTEDHRRYCALLEEINSVDVPVLPGETSIAWGENGTSLGERPVHTRRAFLEYHNGEPFVIVKQLGEEGEQLGEAMLGSESSPDLFTYRYDELMDMIDAYYKEK